MGQSALVLPSATYPAFPATPPQPPAQILSGVFGQSGSPSSV